MTPVVTVEEVHGAAARRRFVELPHVLDGHDPRFAPLVLAWERYRIDRHRNPYLAEARDWTLLLARRAGRPVGRISVHVSPEGEGHFGHWWVDEDPAVAGALLDEATAWLASRDATAMTGPLTMAADQEAGLLVEGYEHAGLTARPWHPPHLAEALLAQGFEVSATWATWRLPVPPGAEPPRPPERRRPTGPPDPAGPYADPRLALLGAVAVPDLAPTMRSGRGRGALAAARRARRGTWDTAVVVGSVAFPEDVVPALLGAASAAGYDALVAPWTPDLHAVPEAVHATVSRSI